MNHNSHNYTKIIDLKDNLTDVVFGKSINEYTIFRYTDIANLKKVQGYFISLRQRIIIPNTTAYTPGSSALSKYDNYPILIENKVNLKTDAASKTVITLQNFFPKTLNTSISTNSSSQTGKETSTQTQNSSGSSTTNVNTFGVQVSVGYMLGMPLAQVSASYGHSWIKETSHSTSQLQGQSQQQHHSHSDVMSVKNWSSDASQALDQTGLNWTWSQSYPWDAILFRTSEQGDQVELPEYVKSRMVSDNVLLPPSELSLFGLDFTQTASWIVLYPEGELATDTLSIQHAINHFTASHDLNNKTFSATMQSPKEAKKAVFEVDDIDLSLYSLAPIGLSGFAEVGFLVDDFLISPTTYKDKFKIMSNINNLVVTGTGFDENITTNFSVPTSMQVNFKINDYSRPYILELAHSLSKDGSDCKIEWTVNEKYKGTIVLRSDDMEENQTIVSLRNVDIESVNFHDYLTLGFNTIKLTMSLLDPSK